MKVTPFGLYQPDERHGEAYATDFTVGKVCGKPLTISPPSTCRGIPRGDSASIDRGYDTLFEAEVAAYLMARRSTPCSFPQTAGSGHERDPDKPTTSSRRRSGRGRPSRRSPTRGQRGQPGGNGHDEPPVAEALPRMR